MEHIAVSAGEATASPGQKIAGVLGSTEGPTERYTEANNKTQENGILSARVPRPVPEDLAGGT